MSSSLYVRTRSGLMFHRTTCRYAGSKSARPWNWAAGRMADEIVRTVRTVAGYEILPCSLCIAKPRSA